MANRRWGGETQELHAPRRRERHRGRKLLVRRDVHRANLAPGDQPAQRTDVEAVFVDRHWNDLGAGEPEGLPRRPIAWMLHGDDIAGEYERARRQRQGHLTAAGHDEAVGVDGEAARRREHRRQAIAQPLQAGRMRVREQIGSVDLERAPIRPANEIGGHEAHVGPRAGHQNRARRNRARQLGRRRQRDGHREACRRARVRIHATLQRSG